MKKILRQTHFYIGVVCIMQAVPFLILFFSQWKKRKSLSAAFLAIALSGAALGGVLVARNVRQETSRWDLLDALCNEYLLSEEETVYRDDEN